MEDLFSREQRIYDDAIIRAKERENCPYCGGEDFKAIVKEYGRILKQLRRITKISDRTTFELNTSKLDLSDRVFYDALTGIYNRRFLDENLGRITKMMAGLSSRALSVLMIDVDFFKRYNDTYGHGMGDTCLKSVAEAVSKSLKREGDFAARYGGEEFVVVLPNTEKNGACTIAKRILESVRALSIPHEKNDVADHVTASIGVTSGSAHDTAESYIERSDQALYLSKQNGRNKYTFLEL